jgi:hypothetical protein
MIYVYYKACASWIALRGRSAQDTGSPRPLPQVEAVARLLEARRLPVGLVALQLVGCRAGSQAAEARIRRQGVALNTVLAGGTAWR